MRSSSWWPRAVPLIFGAVACGGGGTEIVTPPPPPVVEFVLTLVPHPDDLATSTALGWQAAIPAMAGTIIPADSSAPAKPFTATAEGRAAFSGLPAGNYIVEAARWLNATEKATLAAADDAVGFAGRWHVQVASQGGAATLQAPASRRHGLVISEWAFNDYAYSFSGYIELYNNSDTTVYLDGLIVGEGWNASLDVPITPCFSTAPFRNDPEGVWTRFFQRFPGSGRDFPVAPGGTVVVATDAIDHRPLAPRTLDLSRGDFEFSGPGDVDNPVVPNMIDQGLLAHQHGHGLTFPGLVDVPFLALPVDPGTFQRAFWETAEFARVPSVSILDVLALGTKYPPPAGVLDCPPLVHPRFDRQESRARGTDDFVEYEYSVSRRRVPTQGGNILLQWTRSGYADFVRSSRTPGTPGAH